MNKYLCMTYNSQNVFLQNLTNIIKGAAQLADKGSIFDIIFLDLPPVLSEPIGQHPFVLSSLQ